LAIGLAAALFWLSAAGAQAVDLRHSASEDQTVVPVPVPGGWAITIAPYLWATGLAGHVGGGGTSIRVDESFGDIVADLDFGFLGVTEIRYNRFAVFSDFIYGKLSSTETSPFPQFVDTIAVRSSTVIWTGAAEYRFVDAPRGYLDILAGFRLFSLTNELSLGGGSLDGVAGDQTVTWADPIVGIKGGLDVTARLYLTGWAMVGGFGVSSDSVWDVMGGLGYRFDKAISSVLGYRAAGVDYQGDDFSYDTVMQGLFLGIVLQY
jgi:hypothetical protein